jgi:hypothetical protein
MYFYLIQVITDNRHYIGEHKFARACLSVGSITHHKQCTIIDGFTSVLEDTFTPVSYPSREREYIQKSMQSQMMMSKYAIFDDHE